ncbi:MAG: hypothetical protein LV473_21015 [Nitrospira sp.]|nr:hypothetical protein [Nitrospira sp.]
MNYWRNLCMTWKAKMQSLLPIVEIEPMHEEDLSSREWLISQLLEREARNREESAVCQLRLNALSKQLQAAEDKANELREAIAIEQGGHMAKSFEHDAQINKIRAELAATAPPGLEPFITRLDTEIMGCLQRTTMESKTVDRLAILRHVREQAVTLRTSPIPMAHALTQLKSLEHTCGLTAA